MSGNLSGIKITQLNNIGSNISPKSLIPIVDTSNLSNPITDNANLQIVGNLILNGAGGVYFPPASQAFLAQTVTNAAQPNITSVGVLSNLSITDVSVLHIPGGNDGYVLQTDGNGNLSWTMMSGGGGNGTPGGSNTQVQFNNDGMFAGNAGFTFDSVHGSLSTTMLNTGEIYNFSGITLENSDLSHGPTAAVLIPNNGNGDIQINNTYGNVEIQTGNSGTINSSWEFNSNGNLTTPGNVIVTGNISLTNGKISGGVNSPQDVNDPITDISIGTQCIVTLTNSPFYYPVRGTVVISGVNSTTQANDTWYYEAYNYNQLQLFTDNTYSTPVNSTSWTAFVGPTDGIATISYNVPTTPVVIDSGGYFTIFGPEGNLYLPTDFNTNLSSINTPFNSNLTLSVAGTQFNFYNNGTFESNALNLNGNITLNGGSLNGISYNNPNFLTPMGADPAWAYGMSANGTDIWLQTQFYGVGDNHHGFRVYDSYGNGNVRLSVDGTGNTNINGNIMVSGNIIANNIGNVSAINLTGNASQVLYGNGVFGSMPISGTYVLIDEIDINSTTPTVNLIGFNPTLYLNYRVGITGATIDTGSLNFRFSTDNGTTYDSGTLYNWANDLWGSGGYSSYLRAEGDTNVSIVGGISGKPYNAGVEIKIFDPSLSTQYKPFSVDSSFASNDGHSYSYTVKGSYNNISPVNAIQIFNISGNITSGKFRLYGEIK